jgi:hypothetical protein
MEGPISHPVFKLFFGYIEKATPNLHKCPIKKHEEIMLKNLTVDYNFIPSSVLLLDGYFRVDVSLYSTKLGESVYYLKTKSYISIHKRFPYKNRTRTVKN